MANLVYWYAQCLDDADAYSIIGKTKKEVKAQLNERGELGYGPIERKVLQYRDAFDLFMWTTSEDGGRGCGMTTNGEGV
jgi:hypothetical protein